MQVTIVDVFAEAAYEGNQLAVVRDPANISTRIMQSIAREMNLSETTFVTDESEGSASARIFTPGEELPFAGHPVLGTAWVLAANRADFVLEVPAGRVPVHIDGEMAWMTPPAPKLGPELPPKTAAAVLGLDAGDLDPDLPARRITCGLEFTLIGLRSLDALRRIRLDTEARRALGGDAATFVVSKESYSAGCDFAARMHFYDGLGIREDPATGSANAAFAAYLEDLGETGSFKVEQGFEVRRPSRIYLQVGAALAVGGKVQAVLHGELIAH